MIEIINYKPVLNSVCLARFSIKIPKWGNFLIKDISLFSKNNHRWISFPSRSYEEDGKKKYFQYNGFEDLQMMQSFQEKVLKALDEYTKNLSANDEKENNGVPF